jgi:hypothetical protein
VLELALDQAPPLVVEAGAVRAARDPHPLVEDFSDLAVDATGDRIQGEERVTRLCTRLASDVLTNVFETRIRRARS